MVAVLVYTDNKIATAHCKQSETLRLHYNLVVTLTEKKALLSNYEGKQSDGKLITLKNCNVDRQNSFKNLQSLRTGQRGPLVENKERVNSEQRVQFICWC